MKVKQIARPTYSAKQIAELENRLREAEDTIKAISEGSVDALMVQDSDKKQQIFTLKSADYTYRVLIESMSQGALTISADGIILYSNKQFSTLVGKPLEQIIGSEIQKCIHKIDIPLVKAIIAEGSDHSSGSERTLRLRNKNNTEVIVSARKLPQMGGEAYMCVVVTDLTERKKAEFAKDEFISLASHQLRTPATGVKQYIGMLLEGYAGKLTEQQCQFAQTAYDSNERQLSIVNSILKTAQIDFGAYELVKTRQNITALIEETVAEFKPMLTMRAQTVNCQLQANVYCMIETGEIGLVFSNLIENASKYSPEGSSLELNLSQKANIIYFSITDHGVGIEKADYAKIFDKFTRINNVLSDTISGNGLGLYWVKKIVELHKGSINLTSVIDQGSTFTVGLPV